MAAMEAFPLVDSDDKARTPPTTSENTVEAVPVLVVNEKLLPAVLFSVEPKVIWLLVVLKTVSDNKVTAPVYV